MAPVAYGFLIMIGTAALMGAFVGAIGGAIVWRARLHLLLGALLTACAYLVLLLLDYPKDFTWLKAKLAWGIPPLIQAFLLGVLSARGLAARTKLHPNVVALAGFAFSLGVGLLCLLPFRIDPAAPVHIALIADGCLLLALVASRVLPRRAPPTPDGSRS
jgi:hypothetical protein